jgi:exodeoxyribonuclease VII small subunit
MARRKTNPGEDPQGPSFEDSLAGLEAIVDAMENDQLPLEELVSQYEKGSALLLRCESILRSAKERVELITLRNQNPDAHEAEDDGTAGFSPTSATTDDSDDDDIRLF